MKNHDKHDWIMFVLLDIIKVSVYSMEIFKMLLDFTIAIKEKYIIEL